MIFENTETKQKYNNQIIESSIKSFFIYVVVFY
jgi:hypothetical protein